MSLVLSLRAGQDFYVGDTQVVVHEVLNEHHFKVRIGDKTLDVTDAESVEALPDVFMSAGDRPQHGLARVAIDAPQEILILRGDRYRDGAQMERVHR